MSKLKFIKSLDDRSKLNKKLSDDTVSTPYSFLHPTSKKFASDLYWWKQGRVLLFRLSKDDPDGLINTKCGFELFSGKVSYEETKESKRIFFDNIYPCVGYINLKNISIKGNYTLDDRSRL